MQVEHASSGMASSSASVGFLGVGGHWLVLGWLAAGCVFTPGTAFVTPGPLLMPVGRLPGGGLLGGGQLVLGWLADVVFSPGAASEPPAALLGPRDRLFGGRGGGLVPWPPFLPLSSSPLPSSSPPPSSGFGGEDPATEGCDTSVGVGIGVCGISSMSFLFYNTSAQVACPRNLTPCLVGYSISYSSYSGTFHVTVTTA